MAEEQSRWGVSRFHFTKKDVESIVEILSLNQQSIVSVFDVLWHGGVGLSCEAKVREKPIEWLKLIERVQCALIQGADTPEEVWDRLTKPKGDYFVCQPLP